MMTSSQLRESYKLVSETPIVRQKGITTSDKYGRPRPALPGGDYIDTYQNGVVDLTPPTNDWTDRRTYKAAEARLFLLDYPDYAPIDALKARAQQLGTDVLTADQLQDVGLAFDSFEWGGFQRPEKHVSGTFPLMGMLPPCRPGEQLSYAIDFHGNAPQFLVYDMGQA